MSSTEAHLPDRDAVLFLVDTSVSMRQAEFLPFVLEAVASAIRLIHRQGDRHFDAGVVLFDCARPRGRPSSYGNVDVVMKVGSPRLEELRALLGLVASLEGLTSLDGAGTGLVNALKQAKLELAQARPSALRRLVLLTNNDNPGSGRAIQRIAHELVQMNVLFLPMFLESDEQPFDPALFWERLAYLPPSLSLASRNANIDVSLRPYNLDRLEIDFTALVVSKAERKPASFRGALKLGLLSIGIAGYKVVARAAPPKSQKVASENGKRVAVASATKLVVSGTDTEVAAGELQRCFVLRPHELVPADEDDHELLYHPKSASHAEVQIQSFVPVASVRESLLCAGTPLYLVPSNTQWENSKRAFASLWRSMRRRGVAACATYFSSVSGKPPLFGHIYAFEPSGPALESCAGPSTASGMFFVPQPFEDDLRVVPQDVVPRPRRGRAAEKGTASVGPLVSSLAAKFFYRKGYDPVLFPNPLHVHRAQVLEAVALRTPVPLTLPRDATVPNYAKIAKSASALLADLRTALAQPKEEDAPPEARKAKRSGSLDLNEVRDSFKAGLLDRYTMLELRAAHDQLNFRVDRYTDKAGLVASLETHLKEELQDELAE